MVCFAQNENENLTILDFMENKKQAYIERDTYGNDPKAKYSPATLLNKWYEERQQQNIPFKYNDSWMSQYTNDYRKQCKYIFPDRKDYFKMMFDSRGFGQELLMDHLGKSYYGNFTTTYDLSYNHLTKGICGPFPRRYVNGKYIPETDLTKIYDNLTQWGIKEQILTKSQLTDEFWPPQPEYKSNFVKHDMAEVKKLNNFLFRGRIKTSFQIDK